MHRLMIVNEFFFASTTLAFFPSHDVRVRSPCNSNIYRDELVIPDAHNLLFLQDPQQSTLKNQWQFADLIEKDCSTVSHLEQTRLAFLGRSGKRSFDISKELALNQ